MKNKFEIRDDYVVVYVENRRGEIFESYLDIEDLNKLKQYNSWHVTYAPNIDNYYFKTTVQLGRNSENKRVSRPVYAHKLIMGTPNDKKVAVDHLNHNTLDNRKANLVVKDDRNNLINRAGKNKNNKSGYRNVYWDKRSGKWTVQLQTEKRKCRVLGCFDDVHEAGLFAKEMRLRYYRSD